MWRYLFGDPPVNENRAQIRNVKRIANEGDLNMGANSGVEYYYDGMNQQPHDPFTRANWSVSAPVIEGSDEISSKGKINMGPNSGITIAKEKKAQRKGAEGTT